jgi:hypothetical protein
MEYSMRVYGINLFERILVNLLTGISWLLILFSAAVVIFPDVFFVNVVFGTILIVCTVFTGIILGIAGAGIRQNRTSLAAGLTLMSLLAIGWTVNGFFPVRPGAIIAGVIIFLLFGTSRLLRRQALRARFNPRFFTLRQFETMLQVADTMIDADGEEIMGPIEIAVRADHMLAIIDSPVKKNIKIVLFLVEWLLPVLIFRPFPFSVLGSNERRRVVEKVIGASGVFRDAARALKSLTSSGYFGDPRGMAQAGYKPFEERDISQGVDQSPHIYPDPFIGENIHENKR